MNKYACLVVAILLFNTGRLLAQMPGNYSAIYSGTPWFDDRGQVISAHGANIVKDKGRYYLFGEKHSDLSNAFAGFNCYSSADLYNWKFERIALPVQDTGRLGPNRVGERVKVMRCPATAEYIMYMHTDDMAYKDQCICYATSKSITGPYIYQGPLLFNNKPIRKWDMGTFQDTDGGGYLLIHGGDIYKLSDDYKSAVTQVSKGFSPECESPAVFKKHGVYFWLASNRTSWERNDNFYFTATSISGPWTARGTFAPQGTSTYNSQTTFVLPLPGKYDTTFVFMGDRWSYPLQASAATYVWQPLNVSGTSLSIPFYKEGWAITPEAGLLSEQPIYAKIVKANNLSVVKYAGNWQQSNDQSAANEKNATLSLKFTTQVGLYCKTGVNGGYARVEIRKKNKVILSAVVDTYCNHPASTLTFLSPVLPKGDYSFTIITMGQHSSWADKRRADYGSKGNEIAIEKLLVN